MTTFPPWKAATWLLFVLIFATFSPHLAQQDQECSRLDLDCNGRISADEVGQSSFFTSSDADGDGTLGRAELHTVLERLGVHEGDHLFHAVSTLDRDLQGGIQVTELMRHWSDKLRALLTVEDVCDWITHAVELPQYAENFRENAVKGYDLAAMLDGEGDLYLQEIGVQKLLHRKQILRSIGLRLLGAGSAPAQPHLIIDDSELPMKLRWWLPHTSQNPALPLHKWRLYFRASEADHWELYQEFESYRTTMVLGADLANEDSSGEFRLEAWNSAGRSEYIYATMVSVEARKKSKKLGGIAGPLTAPSGSPSASVCNESHCSIRKGRQALVRLSRRECRARKAEVNDLFHAADDDGDGDIDSNELWKFLQSNLKDSLEPHEIKLAIESVMETLDDNQDNLIRKGDFEKYWSSLAFTMTVEATGEWIAHSVNLPQYKDSFVSNSISGFDFSEIVKDEGELVLKKKLGIEDLAHRRAIVRAMKIVLMAVGDVPIQPPLTVDSSACDGLMITWNSSNDEPSTVIPTHKYQLFRRHGPYGKRSGSSEDDESWELVYSGSKRSFLDKGLRSGYYYDYKLVAWNVIGPSKEEMLSGIKSNVGTCERSIVLGLFQRVFSLVFSGFKFVIHNILNVCVPILAIWAAKNSKKLIKRLSITFPRLHGLFNQVLRRFETPDSPKSTHQHPRQMHNAARMIARSRSLSEGHNEVTLLSSDKKKNVSGDDSASVNSADSGTSTSSGKPKSKPKQMWSKLRKFVVKNGKSKQWDLSTDKLKRMSKRGLHHSLSTSVLSSSTGEQRTDVTYRGGARNLVVYGAKRDFEPEECISPNMCMICSKTNLTRKHVCGKCHMVVCEEHTAKKK